MDTIGSEESSKVISDFLNEWNIYSPYYQNFAEAVAGKCRRALKSQILDHEVTSRVKERESLAGKLNRRCKLNTYLYRDKESILHDIQDLAGVRIVVNSSTDKTVVHSILQQELDIEKYPPKPDTPTGGFDREYKWYSADHYVARRKKQDLELQSFGEDTRVEIQVRLRFRNAFAEVPRARPPTLKQHRFMDYIAGLASISDGLRDWVRDEGDQQKEFDGVPFENIHQLGVCLSKLIAQDPGNNQEEEDIGPLKGLQRLLKFLGLDNSSSLRDIYSQLESIPLDEKETIIESYRNIQPAVSVRMMDFLVFSAESTSHSHEHDIDQFTARDILAVIISTFIWLNELFSPASAWQRKLLSRGYRYGHEVKHNDITWLVTTRLGELRYSKTISTEDEERLRRIARWFSHHIERPVQLAYSISTLDPSFRRDLRKEWHLYVRAISGVKDLKRKAVV
jgi:ppGpp synthetase/RelA/SpoT-type nucleotidyltranferase